VTVKRATQHGGGRQCRCRVRGEGCRDAATVIIGGRRRSGRWRCSGVTRQQGRHLDRRRQAGPEGG
jgi:hypothetical protein